jgi:hypothetical protein
MTRYQCDEVQRVRPAKEPYAWLTDRWDRHPQYSADVPAHAWIQLTFIRPDATVCYGVRKAARRELA